MSVGDVTQSRPAKPLKAKAWHSAQWWRRVWFTFAFAPIGLLTVFLISFVGYQLLYRDKIHRGVSVWDLDLGGMHRDEAQTVLSESFTDLIQSPLMLHDGQRTWAVNRAALGIRFGAAATTEVAYAVGRSGSLAWNTGEQIRSALKGVQVAPVLLHDETATRLYLAGLADEIWQPVRDAALIINADQVFQVKPQVGRRLDVEATMAAVRQIAGQLGEQAIELTVVETLPHVIDAAIAQDQAEAILGGPLTLYVEEGLFSETVTGTTEISPTVHGPWTLSREELANMVRVNQEPIGEGEGAWLSVTLDREALRSYLTPLSDRLSRPAVNARFYFDDDTRQLRVIAPSTDGLALDVEATIDRIQERIGEAERAVPLAFELVPAEFNERVTAEELGITELLSSGVSYFAGSSSGRMNNVKIAASKFHGIIIKPGEIFSFNEWLGDVSKEEGYDESLIIYGNETILDVGGGVCQVSTTAFDAAFWAGFPIIERWAHAYRVGYYEQGNRPVGMDATVYSPLVDFRFLNDLPHHLLIETYVNLTRPSLTFKFYSTRDERVVELEDAVVTDVIEHGDPVYKEDPKLEPGEIEQIEWATNGMTAVITRVIRDGQSGDVIERKAFKSKFRPWNAVYLVGPGTEVPGHEVVRLEQVQEPEVTPTP